VISFGATEKVKKEGRDELPVRVKACVTDWQHTTGLLQEKLVKGTVTRGSPTVYIVSDNEGDVSHTVFTLQGL
jgi:hypothetical protein